MNEIEKIKMEIRECMLQMQCHLARNKALLGKLHAYEIARLFRKLELLEMDKRKDGVCINKK